MSSSGNGVQPAIRMRFSDPLEARFEQLLARYPVRRSALIPMLLWAQDEMGSLSPQIIAEIAARLELSELQVEEVVSYYSMLRRQPAGKYHVQVCTNISCMLRGAYRLYEHVQQKLGLKHKQTSGDGVFSLEEVECLGACSWAPALQVNYDFHHEMTPEKFDELMEKLRKNGARTQRQASACHQDGALKGAATIPAMGHELEVRVVSKRFGLPNSASLEAYRAQEGYQALGKALQMTPEGIIEEVKKSALRGRGGAGFPAGMKWGFLPRTSPKPKYIVCNADEGEPGTCKDRLLMEYDPHQLIEGMLIAGLAVGSHQGYIYIRGEYRYLIEIMDRAIEEAHAGGFLGHNIQGSGFDFHLSTHTGAGSYECGEESALLESLEGKRGIPRIRPPFPAVAGLYQCPTVLNNVETFAAVPHIILHGSDWFHSLGTPKNGGTRLFALSGHVNRPGVYELPLGMPLRTMIYEVGGGIPGGKQLKAVIPGGSSTPILVEEHLDIPMDFDSLAKLGSFLGSGGVVVMDEDTCMVQVALRIMKFYAHESCGWCIPCREGTTWLHKMLARLHRGEGVSNDVDLISELAHNILGRTFCPLGDAAAMPTISIVKYFRHEFEDHLNGRPCRFEGQHGIYG